MFSVSRDKDWVILFQDDREGSSELKGLMEFQENFIADDVAKILECL